MRAGLFRAERDALLRKIRDIQIGAPVPVEQAIDIMGSRYAVFESHVIVHGGDSHRNWISVTDLVPVDQQTVSVADLIRHQQPAAILKRVRGPATDGQSLR